MATARAVIELAGAIANAGLAEDVESLRSVHHRLPSLTHVPGVPATVQAHALGCPTAGALLITRSPTTNVPATGAAEAMKIRAACAAPAGVPGMSCPAKPT